MSLKLPLLCPTLNFYYYLAFNSVSIRLLWSFISAWTISFDSCVCIVKSRKVVTGPIAVTSSGWLLLLLGERSARQQSDAEVELYEAQCTLYVNQSNKCIPCTCITVTCMRYNHYYFFNDIFYRMMVDKIFT